MSPGGCAATAQEPTGCKETPSAEQGEQCNRTLTHAETLFLTELLREMQKQSEMIDEALETCEKANHVLLKDGLNDRAIAMKEKGLGDILKAVTLYEKRVDDYANAVEICNRLTLNNREEMQMLLKHMEKFYSNLRQRVENLSGNVETMKILKAHGVGVSGPVDTLRSCLSEGIFAVGLGACLLLVLTSIWIYLLSKSI